MICLLPELRLQVGLQVKPVVRGIRNNYTGDNQLARLSPSPSSGIAQDDRMPDRIRIAGPENIPPLVCVWGCWGVVFFFHSALACSIRAALRAYSRSASARLAWELSEDWW